MKARKNTSKPDEVNRKDLKGLKLDEWDRKNIALAVDDFEANFPGLIDAVAAQAREDTTVAPRDKLGGLNLKRRMAIPGDLLWVIKQGYPSILVDTKQFEQFLKWFPQFDLRER